MIILGSVMSIEVDENKEPIVRDGDILSDVVRAVTMLGIISLILLVVYGVFIAFGSELRIKVGLISLVISLGIITRFYWRELRKIRSQLELPSTKKSLVALKNIKKNNPK